jgi:serine/threonine-protein kinase 24/25/MST4
LTPFFKIDLESSEDDIQEIQQEISVLATCASPYVTQYKASFLKGHKLWIVMEYLGGGSCLDLVRPLLLFFYRNICR